MQGAGAQSLLRELYTTCYNEDQVQPNKQINIQKIKSQNSHVMLVLKASF